MAANLDRPVIVMPTGAPNGAVIVGTGSAVEAHVLVSGTDQVDAVTIEAWNTSGAAITVTVTWPNTSGGSSNVTRSLAAGNVGPAVIIDRWTGNGGGSITVSGAAGSFFKVSVERYDAGKNGRDPA